MDESKGVLSDQTGFLFELNTSKHYPKKLRRVAFYDTELNRTLISSN